MMDEKFLDVVRSFGMANQMAEVSLERIEKIYQIDLGRGKQSSVEPKKPTFDFDASVRKEASEMAKHYESFYCLEVSIRTLVVQRLAESYGYDWWIAKKADGRDVVTQAIKDSSKKHQDNELSQAITQRSDDPIDYTTFGELADLIVGNWEIFGDMFTKREAVQRVLKLLNTLRGPIAHCCPLADHEVARLQLTMADWFKLMS